MRIYLMRHGIARLPDGDPEQSLSDTGRAGVESAAAFINNEEIKFDMILSSPKLRALQTAEIIAKSLDYPIEDIVQTDLLKPGAMPGAAIDFLSQYNDRQAILLVGHMPSLPRIAAALLGITTEFPLGNAELYRIDITTLPGNDGEVLRLFMPE